MKRISHVGIAVSDLSKAIQWYENALGLQLEHTEVVESEKVRIAFFRVGESRIELLEPLSEDSSIAQHISKRGEGFHHIAFEVENIAERLKDLECKSVNLIHRSPKKGAHHSLIGFLHPKSTGGVLMELCEPLREDCNEE